MKHLTTFCRHDVGRTSALTVCSPSARRRNSMLKHLAFMLLFLVGSINAWGTDVVYKTALFGSDYNSAGKSDYTSTWSATNNGFTVSLSNFNNNNNGWTYVKCGRKNNASVATIISAEIDKTVTKVVVTIDALTASKVNSIKLYRSSDNSSWTEESSFAKSTGAQEATIASANRAANLYYKVEFDCASGSSNGLVTISKVEYYVEAGGPSQPTLSSIAVSGTPSKTTYEAGDAFDVTGLVVTGTYSDASQAAITSDITWEVRTNSTSDAVEIADYTLTQGQTSLQVRATAGGQTSDWYDVTGLNVTAVETPTLTFDFSAQSYTNQQQYTSINADANITISFGDGSNDGKYYDTGTAIRVYGGGHMTVAGSEGVTISKIVLEFGSGDGSNTISTDVDSYENNIWNGSAQSVTFNVGGTSGHRRIKVVKVFYEAAAIAVAQPTISGEDNFYESTTVTLACTTVGAAIYYTTNGETPNSSSTQYSEPFALTNGATVKAIAILGDDASAVAEQVFTKITPYTSISAFLTAKPSEDVYVQFGNEVVVTGVNGKNVYVQDAAGNAICIFFANNSSWTAGHKVTGLFQAQYATYGNMPEMKIVSGKEGTIAATETATFTPSPAEISSLASETINANMCKLVTLKGVSFTAQALDNNKSVDLSKENNTLRFYDQLEKTKDGENYKALPLTKTACDVTGILISYKPKNADPVDEILPIDAACIVAGNAELPALSQVGSTDESEPTMVANGQEITITPVSGFTSTLNGDALTTATPVSITETVTNTVIAITAARDYYTPQNATYYFKANPAGTKYAITINQPEKGGTLAADYTQTEENNIVTLTATPTNEHFTFNGWSVTYIDGYEQEQSVEVTNNTFSMPAFAVTVTGSFTEEPQGTATFAKGDADGDETVDDITKYVGENFNLPACAFTYTDHKFVGWNDGTETKAAGAEYVMPAGGKAFTAQWIEGSDFTWTASSLGNSDVNITTVNTTPVSIVFDQAGNTQNAPKYYVSDHTARFYTNSTLTISVPNGKLMTGIVFNSSINVTANKGAYESGTWSGLESEVVFTAGATCKIGSITISYASGTQTTLSIANVAMKTTDDTKSVNVTCNVEPTPEITYTISAEDIAKDVASISDAGVVTKGTNTGSITVTASIVQGTNYTAASTTFTITVTEKTVPVLSFENEEYSAFIGNAFIAPELSKSAEVDITYSISGDGSIAEINAETGEVTIKQEEGSVTITATSEETSAYESATASYVLNVTDPNKDYFTADNIGVTSTQYGDWEKNTFGSGITYSGNTAKNVTDIQVRSDNNNSGIVATTTKGYVRSVAVASMTAERTINVYGSNNAYSSPADLYNENTQGTLIGTLTSNSKSLSVTGNYKYVGLRSNNKAIQIGDLTIRWEAVAFQHYSVTYQVGTGATGQDVTVSDIEEGTTIQLSAKPEGFSYTDHAFAGWKLSTMPEEDIRVAGSDFTVNGDVTFVAQWTDAYTITYKAGDAGEAQVLVTEVPAGEYHLAAKPEGFTYAGHIFMGWKLETALEEEMREVNSTYTVAGSVTFVAQWVEANEVIFVAGTDMSDSSPLMKGGISIAASTFNNTSYYQCYGNSSMTISSEVGDIIKVELTTKERDDNKYNASCFSAEGYSYADVNSTSGVWTGSSETVTLAASAQVRMTQIVVIYTPNGNVPKQAAGLNYETKNYEITVGEEFVAPSLTNPHDLAVTYAGNNNSVATVDAASGALTLTGTAGTVKVTASSEESESYYAGSASYTLVVKEVSDNVNGSWRRVTNAANLEDGERIIIAEYSSSTSFTTMGKDKGNNRYAVASTLSSDVLTPGEGTCVLTLEAIGANTYALKTTGGKYLYAASSSSNYLKEKNDLDENGNSEWTISITNGEATILAQGTNSRKLIRYNSSSDGLFSCYANEGTPSQNAIAIYSKTVKPAANADMTAVDAYADIVIEGGTFTANDATKPLGQVTIKNGAEMEVNATTTTESLVVEDGGKVTLNENVEADVFQIAASKTTNEGNSSGQVIIDVNNAKNLRVTGEAYFDYTLDPSGTASYGYYAFCVPFPVNSSTGIYTTSNVKLYDGIDYVLYSYHGDIRATGNYGWKRFNGTLTPGVFYLISLYADENNVCAHNTIRFKMEAQPGGYNCNRVDATVGFNKFETSTGVDASNSGWNGVGNPTVQYVKAQSSSYYHSDMYVYNHSTNAFVIKSANTFTFTVGSPFFIQAGATASMSFDDGSDATENILAPARVNGQTIERICVSFGNETYKDQLFVAASEDALNSYQITKDLAKMSMGTAKVAQISSSNYGVQLAVEYAPLVDNQATYQLNLFAPAAGTYSISAQQVEGATLYVTYNGAIVWNLSLGDYELDLTRGTTTGYGLLLVVQPNQMPTGVENGELLNGENGVQKILLNGNLYILRDGHLYDAVGKQAR